MFCSCGESESSLQNSHTCRYSGKFVIITITVSSSDLFYFSMLALKLRKVNTNLAD